MPSAVRDILRRQEAERADIPGWSPKYDFARQDGQRLRPVDPEPDEADGRSVPWVTCDPTSHLLAIRFIDSRRFTSFARDVLKATESVLMVRFKPSGRRGITEYHYYSNPDYLEAVYNLMEEAESPGELIWAFLIPDAIAYRRIS